MNTHWDDLRLFLCVAEQGSMSAAARILKLGQATLSRRIGELESRLGEPVFTRASQGVSLTALGLRLLPSAQHMAEWAAEAKVQQGQGMQGKVRIAAPPVAAYDFVAPMVADIRQAHPGLQIELLSAVRVLNLGRGEADLSLRTIATQDPDLVCLDQISVPIKAFASERYVRGLPAHYTAKDLDWICWAAPHDDVRSNRALHALIADFKPAFTSDDYNVQFAACRAGVGAMLMPAAQHRYTQIHALRVLPLDIDRSFVAQLYMVCHKRTAELSSVMAVQRFISAEFAYMRDQQESCPRGEEK